MGKLISLITLSILVTALHGLPQYQNDHSSTTSEPHSKNPALLISSGPQNIENKDSSEPKEGIRPVRDTVTHESGSQPIDKPHITNFPATVDFTKKDTVPSQENIRKTRNTNGTGQETDSRISSLPQTVDFKKKDTLLPSQENNRKTRDINKPQQETDSRISSLPQSVDFKKKDTKTEHNEQQRNRRDTDDESKENSSVEKSNENTSSANESTEQNSSGGDTKNSAEKSSDSNDSSSNSQEKNGSSSVEDISKQSNESESRKRRDLGHAPHPAEPSHASKPVAPASRHETKDTPRLLSEHHSGEKHNHDHREDHPKKP